MKNIFDNFLMKKIRSENVETRFWAKFDMSKVSELPNNNNYYEDQLVKTPTIGRFRVFFSVLHATRAGMTSWRRG